MSAVLLFVVSLFDANLPVVAAQRRPGPPAHVVQVSSEPELQRAIAALDSNSTIVLAPGTYRLAATLHVRGRLTNVAITGSTNNPHDVVIAGPGMAEADSGVTHGIEVSGVVRDLAIANLTITDVPGHAIALGPETQAPRLYNLRLTNAGGAFVRASADARRGGVRDGIVEASVMEYGAGAEAGGIHVAGGLGWIVRGNQFRHFSAAEGRLAPPVVLFTEGSRDTLIEGNSFFDCQQEIALGVSDRTPDDHAGGVIRNNIIAREFTTRGGPAIRLADSPATQVLHNTILSNAAAAVLIEYRFAGTSGIVIRNNLLDGEIAARDGATGTVADNYLWAAPGMFVAPASGDLRLRPGAADVIDQVPALPGAPEDIDGDRRPQGNAADYGADEAPAGYARQTEDAEDATRTAMPSSPAPLTKTAKVLSSSGAATGSDGLPDPWAAIDVGSPKIAGHAAWSASVFTVEAGGNDISGTADEFTFVYQTLDGDGEIVARVTNLHRSHPWAKAGLMIRDELTGGAKYAGAFVTAQHGTYFQYRVAAGSSTAQISGDSSKAPVWLKLSRKGQTFTASVSTDGATWKTIGSETVYLNRVAYAGLAVTSRAGGKSTTATFVDAEVIAASAGNQPPEVALATPTHGATFNTPCSIDLTAVGSDPDGRLEAVEFYAGSTLLGVATREPFTARWNDVPPGIHRLKAVGYDERGAKSASPEVEIVVTTNQAPTVSLTAPAAGTSYVAPASITLSADARDADGHIARVDFFSGSTPIGSATAAPYTTTWKSVPAGSYTFTAVARDDRGAESSSAPVSVIVTEPVNVPPSVALTAPAQGSHFPAGSPITLAAAASDGDGTIAKVEFYAGGLMVGTATASPYEVVWNGAEPGVHTLSAKALDNAGAATISAGVNVTVDAVPSLPAPWETADIGSPARAGSAAASHGTFTVAGAGSGLGGTSDQFRFVYQPLDGDADLSACVASLGFADAWSLAGVTIRASLDANAPFALSLLSAGWGAAFHYRPAAAQTTVKSEPVPAVAPHCVRIVRRGSSFTAYQALEGQPWVLTGSATIPMGQQVYVGLVVTSHKADATVEAVFEEVSLSTPPPNQKPLVTLTGPAAGSSFTAPAAITLTASASDPDGTVVAVEFYAGTQLVGTDSSSPYSVTWNVSTAGTYSLTAVARDELGATSSSAAVSVTVNAPPAEPAPRYAVFNASSNHKYVSSYRLEFFKAGQNPESATPVAVLNIGKPSPVNGEITVDITAAVAGFAPGTYFATAVAINSAGSARSAPSPDFVVP